MPASVASAVAASFPGPDLPGVLPVPAAPRDDMFGRLGTDIMDAAGQVLGRAPGSFNAGLIFVPGPDTWHGFTRRPIRGVRRSLIVNYVRPEWRSRHELAFPETPVRAA